MDNKQPKCYIVAGPNGAGKTTFAIKYLSVIANCTKFVNVDEIAHGLSPLDSKKVEIRAGKLFLELLDDMIDQRTDFSFETTLAGKAYIPKIRKWRNDGWQIILYYLYLESPMVSEMRVRERVLAGGHDIPIDAIYRRYPRSLSNLPDYIEVCDRVLCFDNSSRTIKPIFEKIAGQDFMVFNNELFGNIQGASLKWKLLK